MRCAAALALPSCSSAVKAATAFFALALPIAAHAGLELTAPEGVDLTGVWTIDRERSDDPKEALEELRAKAKDRLRGRAGGGFGGIGAIAGMGGVGAGMGGRRPPDGPDREAMRKRMEQMLSASERIELMQLQESVELNLSDRSVSCTSTDEVQVSLPDGELADRLCGWDDGEFVVEFHGPDGLRRTDRYSQGADNQTLFVRTTVKGGRMPELVLSSVYARSESN